MKKIILIFIMAFQVFACSGDCLLCHPTLKQKIDDKNHRILHRCILCHKNNVGKTGQCGTDCFQCHSIQKVSNSHIPEHKTMPQCIKCHKIQECNTNSFVDTLQKVNQWKLK